jgi:hypothetical protein
VGAVAAFKKTARRRWWRKMTATAMATAMATAATTRVKMTKAVTRIT